MVDKQIIELLKEKEQIKQLELENKRLKEDEKSLLNVIDDLQKTSNEWKEKYNDLGQDFDQLKAKNEELKKQVDNLLHKPEIQDKIFWKIDNEALLGSKDAYIYKLEKTLTEIKEIAEKRNYLDYNECLDDILQKISEVEDE